MRAALLVGLLAAACGDDAAAVGAADAAGPAPVDAAVPTADAPPASADAAPEDLDLALADVRADLAGFTAVPGRGYRLKNPLGPAAEAEALAVASSASGGTFPVGSIVAAQAAEVMVKRRRGWNQATRDWEFFRIRFGAGGAAEAFEVRGAEDTACFPCHRDVSTPAFDLICDHP